MTRLMWDQIGKRFYETGVDHGVLYIPDSSGVYTTGVAWNGLVTVTESPSGAEANAQYADNIKYLNLISAEEFAATIEAFTFPDEFAQFDGVAEPKPGVLIGQQTRRAFGLSYRTLVGNDTVGTDYGYKLHLIYGAQAAPSEKAYGTVNDSPEAITLSWELSTTPVEVGSGLKPTASITIDSTRVAADDLAALETILYGSEGVDPRLPMPAEVLALFDGAIAVTPQKPAYDDATSTITIPTQTGVVYTISGSTVTGEVVINEDTLVVAYPASGYYFPDGVDNDWAFEV